MRTTIWLVLATPTLVLSQPLDREANLNLYITWPSYGNCRTDYQFIEEFDGCAELASEALPSVAFVWVIASHEDGYPIGIAGAQFGIEHDGIESVLWQLCNGGFELPEEGWPASGKGNAVAWPGGCYDPPGRIAKIGFFIVADQEMSGTLRITPDPRIGLAVWANCAPESYWICDENLGGADLAIGSTPVCGDHCESTPVAEASWGAIKSQYR